MAANLNCSDLAFNLFMRSRLIGPGPNEGNNCHSRPHLHHHFHIPNVVPEDRQQPRGPELVVRLHSYNRSGKDVN